MNRFSFKLDKETGSESFQLGGEISPGTYVATLRVKAKGEVKTFRYPVKVRPKRLK